MRFLHYTLAVSLCALMLLNSVPVVRACGPSYKEPIFVFKESPDLPFEEFTQGKLGIVRPGLGRKTLVIAYRYLNGGAFSANEQEALVQALKGTAPEDDGSEALKTWINARKQFVKEDQKLPEIYTERQSGGYDFFPNCTKNAFEVAVTTLKDRAASYGADDPSVKAWLAAQDTVFQSCSGEAQIPSELGAESPAWLRKDREYQIAASYFYSLNFDEARAHFEKIAADDDSPWREVADYLVARTLVRQASLAEGETKKRELYERAEHHLQNLVTGAGKFVGASLKLLALVKYHLHPDERVIELSKILTGGSNDNVRQDLIDYTWLLDRLEARILRAEEERKKKLEGTKDQGTPSEPSPAAKEADNKFARFKRGETIRITIYPKKPDNTPDYSQPNEIEFKYDASETEIFAAFEQKLGRKLSTEEIKEIKEAHQFELSARRYNISPNRKWDNGGPSQHEGCDYGDCTRLTFDLTPAFLRSDELSDWILTFQTEDPRAYRRALAKWHKTDSRAWLVTALVKADKSSLGLPELMRAGEKVLRDEPAYPTIAYQMIRLKMDLGNKVEARKLLDEILSSQSALLPVSAQNQFLELRTQLARGLNEFLKSAQRKPIAFYEDGTLGKLSDMFEKEKQFWNEEDSEKTREEYERDLAETYKELLPWDNRLEFDARTLDVFNWNFPLQTLAEAARSPVVPDYLQRTLVLAVWTRAILLNNDEVALAIAPEVPKVEPKMAAVFAMYLKSRTVKDRRNAALWVLLKFPNLSPFVQDGLREFSTSEESEYYFEESWWCVPSDTEFNNHGDEVPKVVAKPSFLTPAQLEAARREHLALKAIGHGKSYLGKHVIAWARTSPADARIPEALFIAAKANESYKYGCDSWESDEKTQQQAAAILRRRYPQSAWTAKLAEPDR